MKNNNGLIIAFLCGMLIICFYFAFTQQKQIEKYQYKNTENSKINIKLQSENDSLIRLIKDNEIENKKVIDSICRLDNYQLKRFILSKLKTK